jgi:Domain of unknown function (DUF4120)
MKTEFRKNRLVWQNKEHAKEVFQFAKKTGQTKNLKDNLQRLINIAKNYGSHYKVSIGRDFAPYSFGFCIMLGPKNIRLNGGMIYHGSHDGGGNGSGPTFSVCLEPTQGWAIHT